LCSTVQKVAIKSISKKKFLVNERSVTTTRVRWFVLIMNLQAKSRATCRGRLTL
jgi:hypothetical protein